MSGPSDLPDYEGAIEKALGFLGEHFEAVRILCSRVEDAGTRTIQRGLGNWYARQGMAQEFISVTRATEIAEEIKLTQDD